MRRTSKRGRGGRRLGTPGVAYTNRTDLNQGPRTQPAQAPTGLPYGAHQAQIQAQHAIPLPGPAPVVAALSRPTERPTEAVTAGLRTGPGPGPEALTGLVPQFDAPLEYLRSLATQYPTVPELQTLLALAQES